MLLYRNSLLLYSPLFVNYKLSINNCTIQSLDVRFYNINCIYTITNLRVTT